MALDPRTKLYLVALANLLLFFHVDVVVESLTVLLLLLPLLGAGPVSYTHLTLPTIYSV